MGLYIADALGCLRQVCTRERFSFVSVQTLGIPDLFDFHLLNACSQVPLPKVRFSHALHQKNHPIVDSAANGDVVLQVSVLRPCSSCLLPS